MNIRKYLCATALAGMLCVPAAFAQYAPAPQRDQDDRNRTMQDKDRDHDRDHDRDRANNGYAYGQNDQWRNSKAYHQGMKDGEHDRAKNKGEKLNRHHWKNDQDRRAYEAGYYQAYRGSMSGNRDRDHDRDDRNQQR